jgi:hypothetical protein
MWCESRARGIVRRPWCAARLYRLRPRRSPGLHKRIDSRRSSGAPDSGRLLAAMRAPVTLLSVVPVINILTNMLFRETLSLKNLAFELIPAAIDNVKIIVGKLTPLHLPDMARLPRPRHPQPLGDREQPPLGDGHGLPRRRMPRPHRSSARQLHHPQAHGPQPDPKSPRQRLAPPQTQNRRMGRRLPRKPPRRMNPSPDSPAAQPQRACKPRRVATKLLVAVKHVGELQ